MIRQGRSALRTTVIPVLLVRFKMDQTKAGNGNFLGVLQKMATAGKGLSVRQQGVVRMFCLERLIPRSCT
ncbi:hypothetical protein EXN61_09805 [Agrobacterium tumefaciens]|uniref:Uncharacterized protein n=1 Tax=Agrobacterium tumefaciens TaxID=358 RepID=A0A546Y305_AGRTU|nr:hypothetical protein EXN61_09805 [Agrobacterium tumefaciens]